MDDLLAEFVVEALDSLGGLQGAFVRLGAAASSPVPLADARRRLHGLKGACGFLGLARSEALVHAAEDLVTAMDGKAMVPPDAVALLGRILERLHDMIQPLARDGHEPAGDDADLTQAAAHLAVEVARQPAAVLSSEAAGGLIALDHEIVPVSEAWRGLPSFAAGLGVRLGKPVQLKLKGGQIAVPRAAVPTLRIALIALIRNACDHGVENPAERAAAGKPATAQLRLHARACGDNVRISLADDGRGMVREHRHNVFAPGFTTAAKLSLVSGRGMGLNLVRTEIERLGGRVAMASAEGRGAVFTLLAPGAAKTAAGLRSAA